MSVVSICLSVSFLLYIIYKFIVYLYLYLLPTYGTPEQQLTQQQLLLGLRLHVLRNLSILGCIATPAAAAEASAAAVPLLLEC